MNTKTNPSVEIHYRQNHYITACEKKVSMPIEEKQNHRFHLSSRTSHRDNSKTLRKNINSLEAESESLEFKASFSYSCMTSIIETIAAFGNSGHDGTIIIGVNDSGIPIGLRNIRDKHDQKRIEDDLRNRVKQQMGLLLSQAISFEWRAERNNKWICKIRVPKWTGNILFINGNNLYLRMGSTNQLLKGTDMVDFIASRLYRSTQTA